MIRKQSRHLLAFAAAAALLAALPTQAFPASAPGDRASVAPQSPDAAADEAAISDALRMGAQATSTTDNTNASPRDRFALDAAYTSGNYRPLWTRASAAMLRAAFAGAYPLAANMTEDRLASLDRVIEARFEASSPEAIARADRDIGAAWFELRRRVSGIRFGQTPSIGDLEAGLMKAAAGDIQASLAGFEPTHPQYRGLKSVLARYRALARDGGWHALRDGDLVRPGETDPRIPNLRQRLAAEGYLPAPDGGLPLDAVGAILVSDTISHTQPDSSVTPRVPAPSATVDSDETLDSSVETALRRFQEDHGLEVDGVLGPNTLAALNESPESKIRRIVDSMERWREFGPTTDRYVWVNVPSFNAEGWYGEQRQISMKAIVGRPDRPTPIFSDTIEYTVTNPKWFVPVSIALRDKLPKLQRDPGYAAQHNIRVYDRASGREVIATTVDWSDPASARTYRLVQSPGPQNALGQLKIIFPNKHSVYLHGTPARQLFSHTGRAFSSGCIRLHDPVAMARWLASEDESLTPASIDRALQSGQRKYLRYARHTPVHLTYMTVTVTPDGRPAFWRDIYGRMGSLEQVADLYPRETETARSESAPSARQVAANEPG